MSRHVAVTNRIVVVGAGMGGLTAAALLAKAGLDVTVLEAHVYPGGCAGTFYHQGYRFDAGATLAAGFEPGGGMTSLAEELGIQWPVERASVAFRVHLPSGQAVTRWSDPARWQEERRAAFGAEGEAFWQWQERTADRMWQVALRGAPWPPQGMHEQLGLVCAGLHLARRAPQQLPELALDALRPVSARLGSAPSALRSYIDGQLLISAQTTFARANSLYSAAALDMPRRGIAHVRGGIGQLAICLADAVKAQGGQVLLRQRVVSVEPTASASSFVVRTHRKGEFEADAVLFNLPPWDAARLLGGDAPPALRRTRIPRDGWGAFVLYVGVDESVAADAPIHQQVLLHEPLGEGNSVFLSLSLPGDASRAPAGCRALTISTHTELGPWWRLFERDRAAYEARKAEYTERVLAAAGAALPGLRAGLRLMLPGTPVTYQRYTGRSAGWVGGYPQTSLFRTRGPQVGDGLWLVGDSVFPGQSVLATVLGGRRVASAAAQHLP